MKKTSSYIHPRNIHTDFEKNPNIGCRVTDVDRRTDRPTDRPTTRHGNRSSGPKNGKNLSFLVTFQKGKKNQIKVLPNNYIIQTNC